MQRAHRRSLIFIVFGVVLLLWFWAWLQLAHAHGPAAWIADDQFKGANGVGCCGERDCGVVEPARIKWNESDVTVTLPDGDTFSVPKEGVHPNGHDFYYWACRSDAGTGIGRCLFIPSTASQEGTP